MSIMRDLGPEVIDRVNSAYLRSINKPAANDGRVSSGDVIARARAANPFARETRNLTLQTWLYRLAPDVFAKLKAEAEGSSNG